MKTPNSYNTFSTKDPDEVWQLSVDFSKILASGETISSSTWSVTAYTGTDASPSSILSGIPSIVGTKSKHTVIDGLDGVVYRIKATAETSLGNTYVGIGFLPVEES